MGDRRKADGPADVARHRPPGRHKPPLAGTTCSPGEVANAGSGASRRDRASVDRGGRPAGPVGRVRHRDVEGVVGDDVENAEHERTPGWTDGFLQSAAVLECRLARPQLDPREGPCTHLLWLASDGIAL